MLFSRFLSFLTFIVLDSNHVKNYQFIYLSQMTFSFKGLILKMELRTCYFSFTLQVLNCRPTIDYVFQIIVLHIFQKRELNLQNEKRTNYYFYKIYFIINIQILADYIRREYPSRAFCFRCLKHLSVLRQDLRSFAELNFF